ncbi:MAG: zinc-dependent alcohol dehydrogenase family protein, partial [Pseudomonadota bacterium]
LGEPASRVKLIEEPDPEPGPGEVRLSVKAAPIHPADLLRIEGRYGSAPEPLPATPGAEAFGVVEKLGEGVEGLAVGQTVLPLGAGCWADKLISPAKALIHVPADVDPEQAAMFKANPATAEAMLGLVPLEPGDWVAQSAANSAVGRLVIRFAKARGLRTVNVVRRADVADALKADGADAVVVDGGGDLAGAIAATGAAPKLALDAVGGRVTGALARAAAPGATVAVYGLLSGDEAQVDLRDLVFRRIALRGFWLADWFAASSGREVRALYAALMERLQAGAFETAVEARYPLERVAEAVAHAGRSGRSGKILLTTE